MRVTGFIALSSLLIACDGGPEHIADPHDLPVTPATDNVVMPPRITTWIPPADLRPGVQVTFGAPVAIGDVSCFSAADVPGGQLIAATRGDMGQIELIALDAEGAQSETVAPAGSERRRVSACAISLDPKGKPEIIVGRTIGTRGETVHFRRDGDAWVAATIAPFAAAQIAFNARSPRGADAVIVDAWATSVHALNVAGTWHTRGLPGASLADPGALAVAVTVDAWGRSHFALGANYFGERGGQYVYWPGGRAKNDQPVAVAIVIDPADPALTPQIIHAQTERVAGGVGEGDTATHLYRTVIGPDSSATTLWARADAIFGYQQHIGVGGLAARIDDDHHLHTIATVLAQRGANRSTSLFYGHDRNGAPSQTELALRPTGPIAFAGDDAVLVSDHGALVRSERTSRFPRVDPAALAAPPSPGTVDVCATGFSSEGVRLRHIAGVSAVALAASPEADELRAVEWALDRGYVRQTTGDESGWTTADVTPWQVDTMGAAHARAEVGPDGETHIAWPEAGKLAHWTDRSGRWQRRMLPLEHVIGAADLASFGGTLWMSALHRPASAVAQQGPAGQLEVGSGSELVVMRYNDGVWEAPSPIGSGAPEAHAFVAEAASPTIVFAERAGSESALLLATFDGGSWTRQDLGFRAPRIKAVRAVVADDNIIAVVTITSGSGDEVVALRLEPSAHSRLVTTEIGRWGGDDAVGERALHAGVVDGGAAIAWDNGDALNAVMIADGGISGVDVLEASRGAVLFTGTVTRAGRLIVVEQAGDYVDVIGQACAR